MIIRLNKKLFDYLSYRLSDEQERLGLKLKLIRKDDNQSVIMAIDEEIIDKIRDWAIDELQKKGFDINYELTDEGKILEEIIDVFYIE